MDSVTKNPRLLPCDSEVRDCILLASAGFPPSEGYDNMITRWGYSVWGCSFRSIADASPSIHIRLRCGYSFRLVADASASIHTVI
jgi:hypothetical protein